MSNEAAIKEQPVSYIRIYSRLEGNKSDRADYSADNEMHPYHAVVSILKFGCNNIYSKEETHEIADQIYTLCFFGDTKKSDIIYLCTQYLPNISSRLLEAYKRYTGRDITYTDAYPVAKLYRDKLNSDMLTIDDACNMVCRLLKIIDIDKCIYSPSEEELSRIKKLAEGSIVAENLETKEYNGSKYVKPKDFIKWAQGKKLPLHPILVEHYLEAREEEPEEKQPALRQNQIDKLVCQGIAKTLWHEHPDWTIEQIKNHIAIQSYGNGQCYKAKNTLRDWIREVDTRTTEQKTGRPKKPTAQK